LAVEHVLLDQTEVRWMVLAATEVGDANQLVIDRPAPIAVLVACTACGGGTLMRSIGRLTPQWSAALRYLLPSVCAIYRANVVRLAHAVEQYWSEHAGLNGQVSAIGGTVKLYLGRLRRQLRC
jgi:hypothetical protein